MKVSSKFQVQVALPPRERAPVPTEQMAGSFEEEISCIYRNSISGPSGS